jgi:Fur family iron response transcriptional regulator
MINAPLSPTPAERLAAAGLRPTRQRLALTSLVYGQGERHVSAESLHDEATRAKVPVSLATVYNTLRRFTECGLLREVLVAPGKVYFDTNAADHHHFFFEGTGELADIPADHAGIGYRAGGCHHPAERFQGLIHPSGVARTGPAMQPAPGPIFQDPVAEIGDRD